MSPNSLAVYLAQRTDIPNRESILFAAKQDEEAAASAALDKVQAAVEGLPRYVPQGIPRRSADYETQATVNRTAVYRAIEAVREEQRAITALVALANSPARLEHEVIDLAVRAIWASSLMRSWAFVQWCPSCRDGDHWNHEARTKPPSRGPVPSPGACWSLGNGEPCSCPWRPA